MEAAVEMALDDINADEAEGGAERIAGTHRTQSVHRGLHYVSTELKTQTTLIQTWLGSQGLPDIDFPNSN